MRLITRSAIGSVDGATIDGNGAGGTLEAIDLTANKKDPAAGVAGLRTLGTGALQAAAGSDVRFPTAGEAAALAGTSGAPGAGNKYVTDADARNTNTRIPTAHAASHNAGGTDALAIDAAAATGSLRTIGTTALKACAGNDARLSDARTPTAHAASHNAGGTDALAIDAAAATGSLRTIGTSALKACAGNDARLSDARTPTAHAASHKNGGADEVAVAIAAANAIPKAGATGKLDSSWLPAGGPYPGNDGVTIDTSGAGATLAVKDGGIVNAKVGAGAAIAYSKLNLATSIVNADVAAGAAIAKSKLAALAIANADVDAAAAIAYSKLNLATSIVNADVAAGAAIAYSKLNLAASVVNADVAAGAAIAKSKLAALAIVNADVDAAAAIAYSKLNLAASIVNADVGAAAAIAHSKLAAGGAGAQTIGDATHTLTVTLDAAGCITAIVANALPASSVPSILAQLCIAGSMGAGSTGFWPLFAYTNVASDFGGTDLQTRGIAQAAVTVNRISILNGTATGVGQTIQALLRVNAADSAATVTVPGNTPANTVTTATALGVAVAQGDKVNWKCVTLGAAFTPAFTATLGA